MRHFTTPSLAPHWLCLKSCFTNGQTLNVGCVAGPSTAENHTSDVVDTFLLSKDKEEMKEHVS
jgi:hypothetical protein